MNRPSLDKLSDTPQNLKVLNGQKGQLGPKDEDVLYDQKSLSFPGGLKGPS